MIFRLNHSNRHCRLRSARDGRIGGDVSREGVQRDLLPLIEGTTVATKHGTVKTDHILFIASGAFHTAKPSDLLPELQGRLPIRVELKALTRDDLRRILTEPEASLIKQYIALMGTEGVTLEFSEDAIDAVADTAVAVNASVENIGARRLQTQKWTPGAVLDRQLVCTHLGARQRQPDATLDVVAILSAALGDLCYTFRDDQNNTKVQVGDSAGGSRLATSVGGTLLGIGGDVLVVDDPCS